MSFYKTIENLLLKLDKFKDKEGKLLKSLVIDSAFKIDSDLIIKKNTAFESFPLEMWKKELAVTVDGAFLMCKYLYFIIIFKYNLNYKKNLHFFI